MIYRTNDCSSIKGTGVGHTQQSLINSCICVGVLPQARPERLAVWSNNSLVQSGVICMKIGCPTGGYNEKPPSPLLFVVRPAIRIKGYILTRNSTK